MRNKSRDPQTSAKFHELKLSTQINQSWGKISFKNSWALFTTNLSFMALQSTRMILVWATNKIRIPGWYFGNNAKVTALSLFRLFLKLKTKLWICQTTLWTWVCVRALGMLSPSFQLVYWAFIWKTMASLMSPLPSSWLALKNSRSSNHWLAKWTKLTQSRSILLKNCWWNRFRTTSTSSELLIARSDLRPWRRCWPRWRSLKSNDWHSSKLE